MVLIVFIQTHTVIAAQLTSTGTVPRTVCWFAESLCWDHGVSTSSDLRGTVRRWILSALGLTFSGYSRTSTRVRWWHGNMAFTAGFKGRMNISKKKSWILILITTNNKLKHFPCTFLFYISRVVNQMGEWSILASDSKGHNTCRRREICGKWDI